MSWVIKNFFSPLIKKKTAFLLVLFFVILGLLLPVFQAQAFLAPLAGLIMGALAWMIAAFILAIATLIILPLAKMILMWTLDPWFLRVPYTSGGIVDIGWPIVRDLANMGIVMALVIIGLATALRLGEYQARRTLPTLIIIALLINFTPVIMGVVVDAANIVMHFFTAEVSGGEALFIQYQSLGSMIAGELGGIKWLNPLQHLTLFFKVMAMAIFSIFAAIIYLLFAWLFILRRIAIWILVILSPIAFVAYILPATRRFFNLWLNQFIQWSIIGVFAAFFLYLGEQMMWLAAGGGFVADVPSVGGGFLQEPIADLITGLAPYFVATVFLYIGFFVALSTSAMGASGIIAGAQGLTKKGAAWAGTRAYRGAMGKWLASQAKERAPEEKPSLLQKFAKAEWKETKGWKKVVATPIAAVGGYWAARRLGQVGIQEGARMETIFETEKEKAKRRFGKNWEAMRVTFSKDLPYEEQIGRGLALAEEGYDEFIKLSEEHRKRIFDLVYRFASPRIKDVLRANPELIYDDEIFKKMKSHLKVDTKDEALEKIIAERVRTQDVEKLDKEFFLQSKNPELGQKIREIVVRRWGPEYWGAIGRRFDEEVFRSLGDTAESVGAAEIAERNSKLLRAGITSPGLQWIIPSLEGAKSITEIAVLERLIRMPPEEIEREIGERERNIREREGRINELRRPPRVRLPGWRVPREKEEEARKLEEESAKTREEITRYRGELERRARRLVERPPEERPGPSPEEEEWRGRFHARG